MSDERASSPIGGHAAAVFTTAGTLVSVPQGSVVFRQGELSDSVYYLTAGEVRLSICTGNWHELVVSTVHPGDVFGEIAAVDGKPRTATATASKPTEAYAVTAQRLQEELRRDPELASYLIRTLSAEVRRADEQLAVQVGQPTVCRVAARLVAMCAELEPQRPLIVATTQSELATLVGSTRESVARSLGRLRAWGCIRTQRGAIEVLDLDRLRDHVHSSGDAVAGG